MQNEKVTANDQDILCLFVFKTQLSSFRHYSQLIMCLNVMHIANSGISKSININAALLTAQSSNITFVKLPNIFDFSDSEHL